MTRVILALIAVSLAVTVLACGDEDDSGPSVHILLEADLSGLPPDTDTDEAMDSVVDILERRAKAFGAAADVEVESTNRLAVSLRGVAPDEARELLGKTAQLVFHAPVTDEEGNVMCEAADGSTSAVPPAQVMVAPPDGGQRTAECFSGEGEVGEALWEPATAANSISEERVLTGAFLRPNAEVLAQREVGPSPAVAIEFTGEGSMLFEQITTELVGLPLAIFLDEELIGAPFVQQPITGGNAVITGLSLDEARVLAIQLNAGALPAPLRVISMEETP